MSAGEDSTDRSDPAPAPRRRVRHRPWWVAPVERTAALILLVAVIVFAGLALTGQTIPVPRTIVDRIETRANAALAGQARVSLGGAEAIVDADWVPRVKLVDVQLFSARGAKLADLPDVRASFSGRSLMRGQVELRSVSVTGARVALNRRPDGSLSFAPETDLSGPAARRLASVGDVLDAVEGGFAVPALAGIRRIDVTGLGVRFADARTDQVWTIADGNLRLEQNPEAISIGVEFSLASDQSEGFGTAKVDFVTYKATPEARIVAELQRIPSRDLSAQSAALAWLGALDAPISGTLRSGVEPDGQLAELQATLDLGRGALQPTPDTDAVPFDSASLGLSYDPAAQQLDFRTIRLDSPALRMDATARAWLKDVQDGLPNALVAQIAISELKADPAGLFEKPVTFSQGAVDLKLTLDPFRVTLGQLVLSEGGRRISASGRFDAVPKGWSVALDLGIDAIASERLLALWPLSAVPKTRAWLQDNVATAELFDVTGALRLTPETEPRLSLGYEFRDADVRFLRSLPPIRQGAGYATIEGNTYTLVLDRGHITAPLGGDLDMAGSVLRVPDLRIKPAPADLTLRTDSSVTAALSILDQPPFGFLTKAGRAVDIAEGRAKVEAALRLVLANKLKTDDVTYRVSADLTGIRSDRIVPGRPMVAERLQLTATRAGMRIEGPGTLSGIPFTALWRQDFGPENRGKSRVVGQVDLSPEFLDAFGIALPKGSVRGTGRADLVLDVAAGSPVAFRLTSDLAGIGLSIPGLAWTKPAKGKGRLEVEGTLGKPPNVERITLTAPGLDAEGTVTLRKDGSLDAARFASFDLGWFKGGVTLTGQGKGSTPRLSIDSGTADLRRAAFAPGPKGSADLPIAASLDRLTVSEGIALNGFLGDFSTKGGFNGRFTGSVNGAAPVAGTVAPLSNGTGVRISAKDAGAVMRAAGIFMRGRGGALDMTLRPRKAAGVYDGDLTIRNIRVVDAPVLAELLGAVSVIGLLEQLNGSGILFGDVQGKFLLTPDAVEISEGSAIGASLGVSGQGVYRSDTKTVDLQGTVSPIYLLNGIGTIFSKSREGLFGFNYRLQGPADGPTVSVNPLSILTPGMFREIFRSAPPKLKPGEPSQ